jgi:DNA-binding NarL/FixJ family response regulator
MILLAYAENHILTRKSISCYLEHSGPYRVLHEGRDGAALLENIMSSGIQPDVCLTGLQMQPMDGITLVRELKKRWPLLPCIAVAAFGRRQEVAEMIRSGVQACLSPQSPPETLIAAIETVRRQQYYFNELLSEAALRANTRNKQPIQPLSGREIDLLRYSCTELSFADIAHAMGTTVKTVEGMRARLCEKLGIKTRVGLVLAAVRLGYYLPEPDAIALPGTGYF